MHHDLHRACPTCGQTLPPAVKCPVPFTGYRRIIFEAVQRAGKHGISGHALFQKLYGDRQDGGPLTGKKVIQTQINLMNGYLRPHDLQIRINWATRGYILSDRVQAKGLTPAQVEGIRHRLRQHVKIIAIAAEYHVHVQTVRNIKLGRTHRQDKSL